MRFYLVETMWHQKKGFFLHRENIGEQYIFIHFITPVTALLKGKEVNILPGGCVFFEANKMQHFSSLDCELVHDWFHADMECKKLMEKYKLEGETVYYPSDSDEITKIISEIKTEYAMCNSYFEENASASAEKMMIKLARSSDETSKEFDRDFIKRNLFIKARAEIHTNICRQWTVSDMAQLVNMSESRFYYLYKNQFGISPLKDLAETRVQTAYMLLLKKELSVKEVARLTGYNSEYHFIRQFKQIYGTTPGKVAKSE